MATENGDQPSTQMALRSQGAFVVCDYFFQYLALHSVTQSDKGRPQIVDFQLIIANVSRDDFRQYHLEIFNEIGSDVASAKLVEGTTYELDRYRHFIVSCTLCFSLDTVYITGKKSD